MIETFVAVHGYIGKGKGYMVAGVTLKDDVVTEADPIIKYMMGWPREKVRAHVTEKGWKAKVLYERDVDADGNVVNEASAADEVHPGAG